MLPTSVREGAASAFSTVHAYGKAYAGEGGAYLGGIAAGVAAAEVGVGAARFAGELAAGAKAAIKADGVAIAEVASAAEFNFDSSVHVSTSAREVVVSNPYVIKKYVKEIEDITHLGLHDNQLALLKQALQEKSYVKLSVEDTLRHRSEFKSKLVMLRAEWESNTGREWPVYDTHPDTSKIGKPYDAHHIIQVNHGGPNEWWNIHPADGVRAHPKIHAPGGAAHEIHVKPYQRGDKK